MRRDSRVQRREWCGVFGRCGYQLGVVVSGQLSVVSDEVQGSVRTSVTHLGQDIGNTFAPKALLTTDN